MITQLAPCPPPGDASSSQFLNARSGSGFPLRGFHAYPVSAWHKSDAGVGVGEAASTRLLRREAELAIGGIATDRIPLGTFVSRSAYRATGRMEEDTMDGLIYLVGLIVVIMAILSLFGLR
jgi:hypothetical protein